MGPNPSKKKFATFGKKNNLDKSKFTIISVSNVVILSQTSYKEGK
jgi:hypothetical protein